MEIIQRIQPVLWDAYKHRRYVVMTFVAISFAFLIIGMYWPNQYTATTTVFVEQKNILGRMIEGVAAQTTVDDQARIAREIIFGRKLMRQIVEGEPWNVPENRPTRQELMIGELSGRIVVTNVGANLIKIQYTDSEPQRAFMTTQRIASGFIDQSAESQIRESRSAFEFIDQQVRAYEDNLAVNEDSLEAFRRENEFVRPGAEADSRIRISTIRATIDRVEQELREAEITRKSLDEQLYGEEASAVLLSKSTQYQIRIGELQTELDALRLTYHDTYPDIIRTRHQIEELEKLVEQDERERAEARAAAEARGEQYIEEAVATSPVVQQLQQELYSAITEIQTLRSRLTNAQNSLEAEEDRARMIPVAEARLTELMREYDVNKDVYEDLLHRREIARVSMNLDKEQKGLTLRIYEPAAVPTLPSGPRLLHFILAGLLLGAVVPLGSIFFIQQVDTKVRLLPYLSESVDVPVVGVISHLATPVEERSRIFGTVVLVCLVFATAASVMVVGYLKYQGII